MRIKFDMLTHSHIVWSQINFLTEIFRDPGSVFLPLLCKTKIYLRLHNAQKPASKQASGIRVVNLTKKISNPPDLANSPNSTPIQDDPVTGRKRVGMEFWFEFYKDLVTLNDILKNRNTPDKEEEFWLLTKHVWDK